MKNFFQTYGGLFGLHLSEAGTPQEAAAALNEAPEVALLTPAEVAALLPTFCYTPSAQDCTNRC